MVGLCQQTISKYEQGKATPGHFETLRQFENALGVCASELFPDIFR